MSFYHGGNYTFAQTSYYFALIQSCLGHRADFGCSAITMRSHSKLPLELYNLPISLVSDIYRGGVCGYIFCSLFERSAQLAQLVRAS